MKHFHTIVIFFSLILGISICSSFIFCDNPYSTLFSPAITKGIIQETNLREASGIVCSRNNPEMIWVINDSGNSPDLHLIDNSGQLRHSYRVNNATNFDWEDIAIYTNAHIEETNLYIADIGDNFAIRNYIEIFELSEPDYSKNQDSTIEIKNRYLFQYEDGPRDAESLLVDPVNSDILIISKREQQVRIYKAPTVLSSIDTMQLAFISALPFHNITAGDISAKGDEVLLKNYNAIFYWKKKRDEPITKTLLNPHEILYYSPEPQGESITWRVDADGFYTLSEKNNLIPQVLYFYERNK